MTESFRFTVENSEAGSRLDVFVAARLEGVSRSRVQKLIEEGGLLLNGVQAASRARVQSGDVIEGALAATETFTVAPEDIPIDIVYEDEYLAVVNKQRGLAVHPGSGRPSGTLVNALAWRYKVLPEASDPQRPGIVHRLDKDTSGLMIVALKPDTMTALSAMIANRQVNRKYKVLVWGNPRFNEAVVDAALGRDPRHPEKMAVLPEQGVDRARKAETHLVVIERFGEATLMEAELKTGRTHQIRVHCKYAGHDVVGDNVYGGKQRLNPRYTPARQAELGRLLSALDGQALHAWALSFNHPVSQEHLEFFAECPQAMQDVIEFFRRGAVGVL